MNKYRTEPNRSKYLDYSATGKYFITICTENRKCILGRVVNGMVILSEFGKIVENEILRIPEYHKRVLLDEWVVMPNHVHLIIELGDYDYDNGVSLIGGMFEENMDNRNGNCPVMGTVEKIHEFSLPSTRWQPCPSTQPSTWLQDPQNHPAIIEIKEYRKYRLNMIIPKLTGKFQMKTSKQINILLNTPGVKNWQASYHDHVIRDHASYQTIKEYIISNPKNWNSDLFNI